jgi:DNA repair protein RadC
MKELTIKIKGAGKYLEIQVSNHVIIISEGYYSFSEAGLL